MKGRAKPNAIDGCQAHVDAGFTRMNPAPTFPCMALGLSEIQAQRAAQEEPHPPVFRRGISSAPLVCSRELPVDELRWLGAFRVHRQRRVHPYLVAPAPTSLASRRTSTACWPQVWPIGISSAHRGSSSHDACDHLASSGGDARQRVFCTCRQEGVTGVRGAFAFRTAPRQDTLPTTPPRGLASHRRRVQIRRGRTVTTRLAVLECKYWSTSRRRAALRHTPGLKSAPTP